LKNLIITLLFIISFSVAKAQLNQSQSEVMQLMANDSSWTFKQSLHNIEGDPVLSYYLEEKNWIKSFYFKRDSCYMIILIIPNGQLNNVIKDMNDKFISVGNNLWRDNKEKTIYILQLTDGKSFFEVTEMLQSAITKNNSN
jgi:hypothetical protein